MINSLTLMLNKLGTKLVGGERVFRPFYFLRTLLLLQVALTAFITLAAYNWYNNKNHRIVESSNSLIANIMSRNFDLTNEFLSYIGKQIVKGDFKDSKYIYSILKDVKIEDHKLDPNAFSWSCIDWVNDAGFQTVNQREGIRRNPKDMNERSYISDRRISPWKLQFSKPTIGYPSGIHVIPAGIGITSSSNQLIGYLVVGFNINKLVESIVMTLPTDVDFQVSDESGISILSNAQDIEQSVFYEQKIPSTPYKVVTSISSKFLDKDFVRYIIAALSVNAMLFVLIFFAVNHVKNKMLRVAKLAEAADKALKQKINSYIAINAEAITNAGCSLLSLEDEKVNQSEKIIHLISIIKATANIDHPLPHDDNFQHLNVNVVVHELIEAIGNTVIEKGINLKIDLNKTLPTIYTDSFCIRLLLAGLLSYITDHLRSKGSLTVKSSNKPYLDRDHILLEITGDGFESETPTIETIKNSQTNGKGDNENYRSLQYLIKLAESMNCSSAIIPIHRTKTSINVLIPLTLTKPSSLNSDTMNNKKSNVVYMQPKG